MPIRGRGMALALFLNSMASTILAAVYLDLVSWIGYGGAFWMCGAFLSDLFYHCSIHLARNERQNS